MRFAGKLRSHWVGSQGPKGEHGPGVPPWVQAWAGRPAPLAPANLRVRAHPGVLGGPRVGAAAAAIVARALIAAARGRLGLAALLHLSDDFILPFHPLHCPSPSAYKQAEISLPIPKEHSPDILSPKLLSFLFSSRHCQLLERNRLTDSHFLTTHSYLMPLQSGFQPSGSNNSALTQITEESTGC